MLANTQLDLRALSIRQPWAGLIADGIKDIENRTWSTNWRGLVVIHAGQRTDPNAPAPARAAAAGLDVAAWRGYLAVAILTDVHPDTGCCRPWGEPGVYHWVLAQPRTFPHPIAGRGHLGLYSTIPDEVREAASHHKPRGASR